MQYIKCNNVKQEESYIFFRFFQTENNSELQALNRKGCIYNKKHEQYLTIKTKISMYYMKKRFCTQQRKMRSSPGMLLNFFELFIINSIFFFSFFQSEDQKCSSHTGYELNQSHIKACYYQQHLLCSVFLTSSVFCCLY